MSDLYIKSIPVGMLEENCYALGDPATGSLAIIDPGDDAADVETMIARSHMELKMILLTHGHFDHVSALPQLLKKHPGIPVYINQKDYALACQPSQFSNGIGSIPNVCYYDEGDTVQLGNLTVDVLSTPGHTPGSVVLRCEDALFTGDTLFAGSCGRTDFPGGSYRDMARSLCRLAKLEGDYAVYPGHCESSTLSRERRYNPMIVGAMR